MIPQHVRDNAGFRLAQSITTAIALDHPHANLGDWLSATGYLTTVMLNNAHMTKEQRLELVQGYMTALVECIESM